MRLASIDRAELSLFAMWPQLRVVYTCGYSIGIVMNYFWMFRYVKPWKRTSEHSCPRFLTLLLGTSKFRMSFLLYATLFLDEMKTLSLLAPCCDPFLAVKEYFCCTGKGGRASAVVTGGEMSPLQLEKSQIIQPTAELLRRTIWSRRFHLLAATDCGQRWCKISCWLFFYCWQNGNSFSIVVPRHKEVFFTRFSTDKLTHQHMVLEADNS